MVKANEVGIKIAFIPLVYMITSVVAVLLAIPVGSLSDRVGKEKILVAGYLIYAIVYYGFGITSHVWAIVGLFAMYGLYSAATDGIQKAFISDITDKNKQGTGLGIYNALLGITLLPASLIAGCSMIRLIQGTLLFWCCYGIIICSHDDILCPGPKRAGHELKIFLYSSRRASAGL